MPRDKRKRRDGYEASCSDHSEDSYDRHRSELVEYNSDEAVNFNKHTLKDFAVVYETCKSVVSLASFQNRNLLIACSETVVDHVGSETWILTSATLVRIPDTEHEAYNGDNIKSFIGGPIMDLENRIVGVTFFYKETTPLLPVEIATRCLKSFRKHKRLLPWLRVRGQAVHMLDLPVLEDIWFKYANTPSGILVNKVCEISPENCGGIETGDVISELDGVNLSSVAQFTVMFLEKLEASKDTQNAVTLEAVVQRPTDTTFLAKLDVRGFLRKCDKSFQNRWPLQLTKRRFT